MADTPEYLIRPATPADWSELQDLICISLNYWYRGIGRPALITRGPDACSVFFEVYEALDPGCCLIAQDPRTGRLMGSCFYHVRETHLALGIMNAHPNYFGRGVAGALLKRITDIADAKGKPIRLVSSAANIDSYSLYTRAGFYPRQLYHDMIIPAEKVAAGLPVAGLPSTRPATAADLPAIAELEWQVSGIRRPGDWAYFIDNKLGIWHVSVATDPTGRLTGVLASINHPGSNMLGPGVMSDDDSAAAVVAAELTHHAGRTPLFLAPAERPALIRRLYDWGAKNIELHVIQARGEAKRFDGIAMPTFMPETG